MPTYDDGYMFRKTLSAIPGNVKHIHAANSMRHMINIYNGLMTGTTEMGERQTARVLHAAIHMLNREYLLTEYTRHSEVADFREQHGAFMIWLADNPPDFFRTSGVMGEPEITKRAWRGLYLTNPVRWSIKELISAAGLNDTVSNVNVKRSQTRAKCKPLEVRVHLSPYFVDGQGLLKDTTSEQEVIERNRSSASERAKGRVGKTWAAHIDPVSGQCYYETDEARNNHKRSDALYAYHAAAWGMRLYANWLQQMKLDECPLISGLTREWLLFENTGQFPRRPVIMAASDVSQYKDNDIAFILPYYEPSLGHDDKPFWLLKAVGEETRRMTPSRAITARRVKEIIKYWNGDVNDLASLPAEPPLATPHKLETSPSTYKQAVLAQDMSEMLDNLGNQISKI